MSAHRPILLVLATLAAPAVSRATDPSPSAEALRFFETKVRPILSEHCYECHSAKTDKPKGGLRLDTRTGIRRGGDGGPAVVPGDPDRSPLIKAIRHTDPETAMPPKKKGGKLPDAVIADLEAWVSMGAPDPREGEPAAIAAYDTSTTRTWWAYQPLQKSAIPSTGNSGWPRTDIDRFVLAALAKQGLTPVPDAAPATLLRRVHLDLTGLPPSPDAVARFLAQPGRDAYERLVDELLQSRSFGERWGRHWLDVARFAETTGRDVNVTMPEAWRYRDYVIEAFQKDKPFDQFIREQIAGDLLPDSGDGDRAAKLIATGFLAVGPKALNNTDPRQFAVDLADEQIDAVSQAFLGMTIACARCHDHKFDPVTQADYTALAGIFLSTETRYGTVGGVQGRNAGALIEAPATAGLPTVNRSMTPDAWARKKSEYDALVSRRDAALASRAPGAATQGSGSTLSGFDMVRLITRAKQVEIELAAFHPDGRPKPRLMGVLDKPTTAPANPRARLSASGGGPNSRGRRSSGFDAIADSPLFARGNIDKEGATVPRGVPAFLAHGATLAIANGSSGRLELADWIASPRNTLTSRVIVNRVWHWLFGRGLVASVDNFGASGARPSHPELLDHLASQFVQEGWSLRKLIRHMVTSRVYQLDSRDDEASRAIDPDNLLFWRQPVRRLDAETIRDAMLAAGGNLDLTPPAGSLIALAGDGPIGGERYQVLQEEAIVKPNDTHRSIYLPATRSVQPEVLAIFDLADPSSVLGARETTIVPPQALYLLNNEFVRSQAAALARRVIEEEGFEKRFRLACLLTYGREPFADESAAARNLAGDDPASWIRLCRALFASADFLFLH